MGQTVWFDASDQMMARQRDGRVPVRVNALSVVNQLCKFGELVRAGRARERGDKASIRRPFRNYRPCSRIMATPQDLRFSVV